MLISLSLPVLILAGGITGIPGLNWLKGFKIRRPPPPPADTLPPVWKTPSRLALENQLLRGVLPSLDQGPLSLKLRSDPRSLRVGVDPDSGLVTAVPQLGDVQLGEPTVQPLHEFSGDLTRRSFQRQFAERAAEFIRTLTPRAGATTAPTTGLSFKLPSPLPRQVQSLLGPGGPALNISGSENIRLSGTSNWTNQQIGIQGRKPSLFPSLDMQQDLDIRLEGQLSDRVRVNLLQNSGIQIPLANRIAINYKGEEDDLVQQLDLGNTNLSLPGTQYVSYSGKNEGLFGVKSAMRVGPLDFSVLASKQEGRSERASYRGGASSQHSSMADVDYVHNVYFFLYDPNLDQLDIKPADIKVYLDDYNYTNDQNSVQGRAFMDRGLTCGAYGDPNTCDTTSVRGTFTPLYPGENQDYEILEMYGPNFRVIKLNRQVSGDQRLAVTYRARRLFGPDQNPFWVGGPDTTTTVESDGVRRLYMKLLRPPSSMVEPDPATHFFTRDSLFALTRDLELRNIYQLPGQQIDQASFTLSIRKGVDDPPVTSILSPAGTSIPYIEVLGLDSYDQSRGGQDPGHDGRVDGTYLSVESQQYFVDYVNGILFFPDPRPFAPRIGDKYRETPGGRSLFPFDEAISTILLRGDSLIGTPEAPNAANVAIYDKQIVERSQDVVYYIDVDFTAARALGEINLGRGNILEGSDVVSINGQALVRDRDYSIDYDLGRVTMKRQLGPADQLNIDYSYAPLFQQAGRTLIGSAFRLEGREKGLGGAFMYESKGAQDIRPRLGEEPSRTVIGDLNTAWTFRPDWMTHMVDRLPGVRTTAPSEFSFQAEVGASFPNPNTKNIVYIDDMEGVRDGVSLTMNADRWTWTSPPGRQNGIGTVRSILDDADATNPERPPGQRQLNTEIHWFTPVAGVKEGDLKPNLTDAEGAKTAHPVLALSLPRRPRQYVAGDSLWAGLTYPLDRFGLDLSRAQFIELWVNDFYDSSVRDSINGPNRGMKLHIDLGWVSEDQMRSPDKPPNNKLDTEDRSDGDSAPDGQLDVSRGDKTEDTGFDQLLDGKEPGPPLDLINAGDGDPEGDDWHEVKDQGGDLDPDRYRYANGTEGNHTVNPNPDTEDLNLNGVREIENKYFEYTIPLCDTCETYLVTDVQRDFGSAPLLPNPVAPNNGWRRYRIPILDTLRTGFGSTELALAQARHVRVWLEGVIDVDPDRQFAQRPLLMLGGLDIVGSRWRTTALTDSQKTAGTNLTLNSLNTVDNAGEYSPPFVPGSDRSGGQVVAQREQSLAVEFENLTPGDTLEVFRTFSIDEDYSRYGKLDWFVTGLQLTDYTPGTPLFYFVRFSSDELGRNYYEYRAPVPLNPLDPGHVAWDEIKLELTALSNLKLAPDFPTQDPILYRAAGPKGNDQLVVKGRPSFTRLRRISFGIMNEQDASGTVIRSGKILLDEMVATDIAKDAGYAERLLVNGRFSNLLSYNLSWNARDANFQSVGESRGSGNSTSQLSIGGNFDLHRFFEGTGIVLPIGVNYARNSSRPRFTAGDDVIRTGALEDASETRTESRNFTTSYSRQWNERSNPFLRYTLGGITANYSRNETDGTSPSSVTSFTGQSATVNYGITPRNLLVLGTRGSKLKFYPLPERVYWNYTVSTSDQRVYDRHRDASELVLRNAVLGRTAFINFGADTRPIEALHHHIEGVRNLTLPAELREQLGFINLGKVVAWRQNLDAHYSPNRGAWMSPTFGWTGTYNQDNRPELSKDLSIRAIGNGQSITAGWLLPFDRLQPTAPRPAPGDTGRVTRRARAPVRSLLSRLGGVNAEASYNQTSSYSRLLGTPEFLYLIGVSDNPGLKPNDTGRMRDTTGNAINKAQDWRTAVRTRLSLISDAAVALRGEYSWRRTEINLVPNRTATARFPDLELEYGRLPTQLQLNRIMNSPRLRTSYSRSRVTEYRLSENSPNSIATSSQWQPLLGLTGEFKNQTRAELKLERRVTVREAFDFRNTIRTDRNTDVNLSLNRSYSRGQKVKFLGKESTIKSSVQLGLTAAYSRVSGDIRTVGSDVGQLRTDQDRLSVNGTGSYSFSNNVTGSLALGFGQNRDLVRDAVGRNVRVELRAAFTF